MTKLPKIIKFIFLFSAIFLPFYEAQAVCPVCTVAVGACVGLAEYLGIDDTITGLWIGGLLVSVTVWTISWMEGKNWKFKGYKLSAVVAYILFIVGPLYWKDLFGHPFNKIWGIDKLVFGIVAGVIFFFLAAKLNEFLKMKNGGKVYFPFQKVVVPIVFLSVLSGILYLMTC